MTQRELVWGLLVLSEVVYVGYKRNLSLPAEGRTGCILKSLLQALTTCYQLNLLNLALQDSREEPAADKWVLLLGLVEIWEASKPGCQAWKAWLLRIEVMVRCRGKWRIKLVNPDCKVLCHAMSTKAL